MLFYQYWESAEKQVNRTDGWIYVYPHITSTYTHAVINSSEMRLVHCEQVEKKRKTSGETLWQVHLSSELRYHLKRKQEVWLKNPGPSVVLPITDPSLSGCSLLSMVIWQVLPLTNTKDSFSFSLPPAGYLGNFQILQEHCLHILMDKGSSTTLSSEHLRDHSQ